MNIFRRRKILRNTNALDLVPVRIVSHSMGESKVILFVPKFESKLIHTLFPVTDKMFFRIKLDENGSKVWLAIDGIRNVEEIGKILIGSDNHEEELSETQNRLLKFISLLYEKKYITFRQLSDLTSGS